MDIKFDKIENLVSMDKLNELLKREQKKEEKKCKWGYVIAIAAAVIAVAALAYGVYRYLSPDYLDDFEDDFEEDDFEDEFEEDDFED